MSRVFTVKSAYNLAESLKENSGLQVSSSTSDAGDHSIWDLIWKSKVPNKIKLFAWRVAMSTLATKANRHKRTITHDGICTICGCEEEDEFHAVVRCTKSTALRHAMRKWWNLPAEKSFQFNGEDRLQCLLDKCTAEERTKVLLLLWRAWFLRENCIHGNGKETITGSVNFLCRYMEEIKHMHDPNHMENGKEKLSLFAEQPLLAAPGPANRWTAPPRGVIKLNTDASF